MSTESQVMSLLEEGNPATEVKEASWSGKTAAAYLATLEARSSEVTDLDTKTTQEESEGRSVGVWLAAAAVVIILVAAVALMTRTTEEVPVATTPTATTLVEATPTTLAEPPATVAESEAAATTVSPLLTGVALTIGDQTWEFDGASCASIGGDPGEPGAELVVSARHGDLEVYVNDDRSGRHVSINNEAGDGTLEWVAETGSIFIKVDGNTVSAEGTFTDMANGLPKTEGTLTATCESWREG